RSQVGPDTVVISLLNGITSEIEIGEAYGKKKILLSLALGTDPVRTGDGTTFTTLGTIPFGEAVNREGTFSRNVLLIEDFFKRVGLRYDIPEDMTRALWKKFMMNVGVNQVTALLRCRYGAMQRAGLARDLAVAAMTEVVSIAERENVNLPEGEIEDALKILATLSPEGKTSTLQDVEAHRQTEAGIFGGTVTNLGRRHGVPVPVNEMLFKLIKATEEAYPYSIHP
ncbi:MAG: 2-dehydropantoate 2-reductase, partial [Synergistaceae bacterium]|nr:2-dehydropantoate 2-reductase [Synergistaceae bacterium]